MWILLCDVNFLVTKDMKQKMKLNWQLNIFLKQDQEGELSESTLILGLWREDKKEEEQVGNKEEMILE